MQKFKHFLSETSQIKFFSQDDYHHPYNGRTITTVHKYKHGNETGDVTTFYYPQKDPNNIRVDWNPDPTYSGPITPSRHITAAARAVRRAMLVHGIHRDDLTISMPYYYKPDELMRIPEFLDRKKIFRKAGLPHPLEPYDPKIHGGETEEKNNP